MNNKELFDWAAADGWKKVQSYYQSPNNHIILSEINSYLSNEFELGHDSHKDYACPFGKKSIEVDAINKLLVLDNIMAIKYEN